MRMGVARGVGTARGATSAMPQGTWPHVRPLPPCSSRSRRTPRPAVSAMMQGLCLGWRAQGVAMAAHGTNTGVADARVPDSMRLDDTGRGWAVSITTLMNERVSIGGGTPPRGSGPIADLVDAWQACGSSDPVERDKVMRLWVDAEVSRLTNLRAAANRRSGTPGPEGSVAKLAMAELNKSIYEAVVDLMGPAGMTYASYEDHPTKGGLFGEDQQENFLRARANSIEGGTSEVLKNILGERVLGLPGDVRVDKELPWAEVPRS